MSKQERFLTPEHIRNREKAGAVGRALFPTEIEERGGLDRAKELLRKKYGLIIASSHPSLLDLPRGLAALWDDPDFLQAPTMLPIAYYQDRKFRPAVDRLSRYTAVDRYAIVTRDAVRKNKNDEHLPVGYGNVGFYRGARRTLSEGGILYFMPSAGIRERLELTGEKATEFLFTHTHDRNVALLTVGVNFPPSLQYGRDAYKANIRRKYTLRFGDTYTNDELVGELIRYREGNNLPPSETRRPFANLDDWIMETQFPPLVEQRYQRR